MAPFFGIARPGVYNPVISGGPSAGEFAASGDPDAAAYIAAVEAADGQALEDGVKDAIYDFVLGCKADGIWDAIKSSAILAGARTLNGALVPLVGTAPTNNNFVSGDYNRLTGLAGDGLTKYLDSNRANNADPQNDKHASVYVTTPGADGPPIGSNNFGITGSTVVQYDQSFPRFITRVNAGGGGGVTSTASTASFIGVSRDNASSHIFRFNNTFATISYASQTPSSSNVKVFYDGTTFYSGAVKFYSIGESIDLALLDARVSALMTDIDAAFDSLYALAGAVPTLDLKLAENGDFTDAISGDNLVTFSRSAASSPGTYVGSDGLIKTAAFNNILYSEQFNTGWTLSGVTVLPDAAVSPDGETTADKLVATTVFGVSSNRIYRSASGNTLSIYAKKAEADEILIRSGDGSDSAKHVIFSLNDGSVTSVSGTGHSAYGSEDAGNGWFRLWVNSNTTYIFAYFAVAGASCANGNGIYIWGAQLEEGGAVNPYIPTTSQALAAARFDHDPLTGESLGLLVEEQRTNLWTYSGDPDSLSWGLFGVTRRTTSPIAAPDGTSISTVFDFSAAPGRAIEKSIAASGNNTVSAYLRTESGTETMYFTLNNGSNIYSQPFTVTDEWQRFSFTLDTTGGTGVVAIRNGAAGGAKSVYAWGVQYEAGASPTSYIPTTSAAMTRAADIATIEGADFASWYNSTDGTGYGEFDRENPGSSLVQVLFHFAGPVGRFALYEHVPALAASGFYNLGVSACPVGTFCKHSGAFSGGGSGTESSAFDGVVVVGEAGTVNPDVNKLYIGSRPTGQQLNGHIKRLTYWNTRLPDANLGAITS
jgi:hypothetical protein